MRTCRHADRVRPEDSGLAGSPSPSRVGLHPRGGRSFARPSPARTQTDSNSQQPPAHPSRSTRRHSSTATRPRSSPKRPATTSTSPSCLLFHPGRVLDDHLHVTGLNHLLDSHGSGRGVVLTTAHISNPEVAVKALAALDIPAVALVERLDDPRHLEAVNAAREAVGIEFLTATQTGIASALRALREGGVVCILWDRDRQGGGTCVPFFGRQARFPVGAVDLALRAEADVLPLYAIRRPGRDRLQFDVSFMPPLDLLVKGNRALDIRTTPPTSPASSSRSSRNTRICGASPNRPGRPVAIRPGTICTPAITPPRSAHD